MCRKDKGMHNSAFKSLWSCSWCRSGHHVEIQSPGMDVMLFIYFFYYYFFALKCQDKLKLLTLAAKKVAGLDILRAYFMW